MVKLSLTKLCSFYLCYLLLICFCGLDFWQGWRGRRLICCNQKKTGKEEIENQRKGEPKDLSLMRGIQKANLDMPACIFPFGNKSRPRLGLVRLVSSRLAGPWGPSALPETLACPLVVAEDTHSNPSARCGAWLSRERCSENSFGGKTCEQLSCKCSRWRHTLKNWILLSLAFVCAEKLMGA